MTLVRVLVILGDLTNINMNIPSTPRLEVDYLFAQLMTVADKGTIQQLIINKVLGNEKNLEVFSKALSMLIEIRRNFDAELRKVANSGLAYFNRLDRHYQNILMFSDPPNGDTHILSMKGEIGITPKEAQAWSKYFLVVELLQKIWEDDRIIDMIVAKFVSPLDTDPRFTET